RPYRGRAYSRSRYGQVNECLVLLAANVLVSQDHLVDAVIVPLVMRGHLVDPLGHARIGIAGKNGHRPFIVAWPLHWIPSRRVGGPIVDEIQLGIVGIPAPSRTATNF